MLVRVRMEVAVANQAVKVSEEDTCPEKAWPDTLVLACSTSLSYAYTKEGSMWANIIKDRKAPWSLLQECLRWVRWGAEHTRDCSVTNGLWSSRERGTFHLSPLKTVCVPFSLSSLPSVWISRPGTETLTEMNMQFMSPLFLLSYPPASQLQWWYLIVSRHSLLLKWYNDSIPFVIELNKICDM